jgi:hypothetical protein
MLCELCQHEEAEPPGELCGPCAEAIERVAWAQKRIDAAPVKPIERAETKTEEYRKTFGG